MTSIAPLHQIDFPDAEEIVSIAFSPDGSVLYVHAHQEVINLWALLVYGWPEIATGAMGLVALALVWSLIRVLRRPRRAGERYCRRCNYHLAGLPAAAAECPECGRGFGASGAAIGRRRIRRMAPALVGLTAVGVGVAAVWSTSPAREGAVSGWFHWPSRWAFERWTACPVRETIDTIFAVNPSQGAVSRTVTRQPFTSGFNLRITPDGGSLFLAGSPTRLQQVCTSTGRILRVFDLPERKDVPTSTLVKNYTIRFVPSRRPRSGFSTVFALSKDGSRVFTTHQCLRGTVQIFEWSLTSGTSRHLADIVGVDVHPRLLLVSEEGPIFASHGYMFFDDPPLLLHDGRGNARELRDIAPDRPVRQVLLHPDQQKLLVLEAYRLSVLDPDTAQTVGLLPLSFDVFPRLVIDGVWMAGRGRGCVHLWKVDAPLDAVTLDAPVGRHPDGVALSVDTGRLAAFDNAAGGGTHCVWIYDIAAAVASAGSEPPPHAPAQVPDR